MAIRAISVNVIREAIRQKIIYVTVLFTLLLFAIEPMLPSFQVGLRIQLFNDIALGVSYIAIAIIAIALTVNQIPSEVEKRTIYNVLSKPIRRIDFLLGKFLGVQVVLLACAFIMGMAIFAFTYGYFGKLQIGLLQGVGTNFLEAALISAFSLLVSTFVSPTVNVFCCILFYFAGHAKHTVLGGLAEQGGLNGILGSILSYAMPSLDNYNVSEAVARGAVLKSAFVFELFLYTLVFSSIMLFISSVILSRKEL